MTSGEALVERDRTFDIMKGIGILLMITAHFFNWNHLVLGRCINSFHMPMFFCLSGYFYKYKSDWKKYVKKKIGTLWIPFEVSSIIMSLFYYVMGIQRDTSIKDLFKIFHRYPPSGSVITENAKRGSAGHGRSRIRFAMMIAASSADEFISPRWTERSLKQR